MLIHKDLIRNHMIQVNIFHWKQFMHYKKEGVGMSGGYVVLDINQQIEVDIVMILM